MAAKKLAFELTKGATLPTMVMGDRHRLQQILSHPVSYTHLTLPTSAIV